ncbi:hypothetical protein L204_100158 [Cryptococcus depauperatus]|nr:ubiquitin-conjugating enzyme E2 D/E [Cryptococcus depauperatus CBS 7855]
MSSTSVRRIQKELSNLMTSPPKGITVVSDEDNMLLWRVTICGPPKTPYSRGRFVVTVEFGKEFPFKPPTVKFQTRTYHPNIDSDGNICISLLKSEHWKPATRMDNVLTEVFNLLAKPNLEDPLVTSIAEQYQSNRSAYNLKAEEYVQKYAM